MPRSGTFDTLNPFIVRGRAALGLGYVSESLMQRSWDEPFSLYGLIAEIDHGAGRPLLGGVHPAACRRAGTTASRSRRPTCCSRGGRSATTGDPTTAATTARSRMPRRPASVRSGSASAPASRPIRDAPGDREMPLIMGLMPILPEHAWKTREFDRTTLEPLLGNGAYRIKAVDPGRSITYERVADYWAADLPVNRGLNNFDQIRYDYYLDDTVLFEAFMAGRIDYRQENRAQRWNQGYDVPAVKDGNLIKRVVPDETAQRHAGLYLQPAPAAVQDVRVREAINCCTISNRCSGRSCSASTSG